MTTRRTVHVEHCMGTVFSIDIRDTGDWDDAVADVVRWLHEVDAVFSTYRSDSDISSLQRGERPLDLLSPDVATVLGLCADLHLATDGYFSALSGGRLDPTGLVKGWAVERASVLLRERGSRNHAVNGGGDVQTAGSAAPDRPWTIAITDPLNRSRVLTAVTGNDLAVATSGTAERGKHIVDPFTGAPASRLASATVVGPSLTYADAYATAAFVRGPDAVRWIEEIDGYELLLAGTDGGVHLTTGWPDLATSAASLAG